MADLPLLTRKTLRARLLAEIRRVHPRVIDADGRVDFTRARLLDALGQIPPKGLAKVGDLRRFWRAADRSRPPTNNEQPDSLSLLASRYPMTVPDDTLLRGETSLLESGVELEGLRWLMLYYVHVEYWEGGGTFTQGNEACYYFSPEEGSIYLVDETNELSYPAMGTRVRNADGSPAEDGFYATREYTGPGKLSGEVRVFLVQGGIVTDYETCT